jgi:hypothetical protein
MMKFRHLKLLAFGLAALSLARPALFAADAGKVQLAVAAPDPVVAGEEVTFQVIAVNIGSNKWPAGQYVVEAEVYDAQKNFIAKATQIKGAVTVDPGMPSLVYIPFSVPSGFVGTYFYRVFVVYSEQRVVESEFYPFNVIPLPVTPQKPSKFKIGGNAVISYRQSSRYEWKDYTGNINLNLVGQMMEHAMLFNLYTFHTPKSTAAAEGVNNEIYTILFNYYGDNYNLGLGDVLPMFSPLSLYGTGMRGGMIDGKTGPLSLGAVFARTQKPVEGSDVTDGTYERWLMGGRAGVDVFDGITVGANYVGSYDRQDSLTVAGPSIRPASNYVSGGIIQWNPVDSFGMEAEYQSSQYIYDMVKTTTSVSDYAYRGSVKLSPGKFNMRVNYQVTRPNFYAFGSPGATRDRQSIDLTAGYIFFNRLNLTAGLNRFKDNLLADPNKVTTTQSIYSGGLAYSARAPWPSPSVYYSMNEAVGDPLTAQNNNTKTMTFGLIGRAWIANLGITIQQSAFRDLTLTSDDLDTNTVGLSANTSFGTRASINLGTTLTSTKNLIKGINNQTPAYSLSMNTQVVPNKLSAQVWGTYITRQNDAITPGDMLNRQETTGNGELSWLVGSDLTWSVGGSYSQIRDDVAAENNYIEHGANTRLSYSF